MKIFYSKSKIFTIFLTLILFLSLFSNLNGQKIFSQNPCSQTNLEIRLVEFESTETSRTYWVYLDGNNHALLANVSQALVKIKSGVNSGNDVVFVWNESNQDLQGTTNIGEFTISGEIGTCDHFYVELARYQIGNSPMCIMNYFDSFDVCYEDFCEVANVSHSYSHESSTNLGLTRNFSFTLNGNGHPLLEDASYQVIITDVTNDENIELLSETYTGDLSGTLDVGTFSVSGQIGDLREIVIDSQYGSGFADCGQTDGSPGFHIPFVDLGGGVGPGGGVDPDPDPYDQSRIALINGVKYNNNVISILFNKPTSDVDAFVTDIHGNVLYNENNIGNQKQRDIEIESSKRERIIILNIQYRGYNFDYKLFQN